MAQVVTQKQANLALYESLMNGEEGARDELIQSNMPLASHLVKSVISRAPGLEYIRDDLFSEAFLGLTIAVDKMSQGAKHPNPNPSAYMKQWIKKQLDKCIHHEIKSQHDVIKGAA